MKAGADFVTTASYQASIPGFIKHLSVTTSEAVDLFKKSVDLCKSACDDFWQTLENHCGNECYFSQHALFNVAASINVKNFQLTSTSKIFRCHLDHNAFAHFSFVVQGICILY